MRADRQLLRILDANINRAREALRVCEDLIRLGLGSKPHFVRFRALRYALNDAVKRLPVSVAELATARDSQADPGRRCWASAVRSRDHLLLINLQRAKEALRVLEESSRLLAPARARGFQQLRFRVYDAERALLLSLAALRDRRRVRRRRT